MFSALTCVAGGSPKRDKKTDCLVRMSIFEKTSRSYMFNPCKDFSKYFLTSESWELITSKKRSGEKVVSGLVIESPAPALISKNHLLRRGSG